ncbi:hypothetical protein BT96DRAFT_767641, partial [Gymnopus androsaceus JB14]
LSFPSLLRNPGIKDRYGHLYESNPKGASTSPRVAYKKTKRDDNEGKRWIRRKENALFVGNPHIAQATKRDYTLQLKPVKATFPEPLPPYLQRNSKLPANPVPETDPNSALNGRFSLSIKGMRRDLRRAGFRAEHLVREVEAEILNWLTGDAIVTLHPDNTTQSVDYSSGHPVTDTGSIFEVFRTPQQLIWRVSDDAFARYVVHCCARFHSVVSYSKEVSGLRLTYLLRPNVIHPDRQAAASLDTPPITDLDDSSRFDSDSEFTSSAFADSDVESVISHAAASHDLSDIEEQSLSGATEAWSVIGESDADGVLSEGEHPLVTRLESMTMQSDDPDRTLEAIPIQTFRHTSSRWQSYRSSSSPSRSPARATRRRPLRRDSPLALKETKTLYAYLYS